VQIVGLRKKLGDSGQYIETVRGVGYRFKETE
jgi:two-component system phosphate regulon response regulator PhoB